MRRLAKGVYGSAAAWAFLVTAARGLGFFLVTAFALRVLPAEDIGLWYTIFGIVSMSLMSEFGFNVTIGRFASYYMGGARRLPAIGLPPPSAGGEPNYGALNALVAMARRLYRGLAVLTVMAAMAIGGGWLLMNGDAAGLRPMHIHVFVILALGAGLNMSILFWFGMLYGVDRVRLHNQLMLVGLLVGYVTAFAGLLVGLGLYAMVAGQIVLHAIPRLAARRRILAMLPAETRDGEAEPIAMRLVWPMTWRAGLLYLGSYLSVQNLTLICSFVEDLETTGSFGLTLQLALMLHIFSSVWLSTKLPRINSLRSQGRNREVMHLMARRIPLGVATYAAGAAFLMAAGPPLLKLLGSNTPLLPPVEMAMLFGVVTLNLVVGFHSAVLQTGNEVPHLPAFIFSGVLTAVLGVLLGGQLGVRGVILAPFLSQLLWNYWHTPKLCWQRLLGRPLVQADAARTL